MTTSSTDDDWPAQSRRHLSPVLGRYFERDWSHGSGHRLFDTDGRAYLDFACGIAVTALGHGHPAVNAAIDRLDPAAAKRVVMTGRVDESARSWLLRNATVLAYPSLDEGFGFPLLDAMQAGLPIVASDVGSIPEVAARASKILRWASGAADSPSSRLFVSIAKMIATETSSTPIAAVPATSQ